MVYDLPEIGHVISNSPVFNKALSKAQDESDQFYDFVKKTESCTHNTVLTGKLLNEHVSELCGVLEDVSMFLTDHSQALEKFSGGMMRIETYREMLITQTEVLTLQPLAEVLTQLDELKNLSDDIRKVENLVAQQTDQYCSTKATEHDEYTTVTYPKLCVDTLALKRKHALDKLEYVAKLRHYTRSNRLNYVRKMLEQMLAQYSYANFAYVVMSEMEPYLSELFTEFQTLQKENAELSLADVEMLDRAKAEIVQRYDDQIKVTKETYPNVDTEVRNSSLKSLLSFAVTGKSTIKLDYLTNKRDSFLSYINNENATGPLKEIVSTTTTPKPRHNPFTKEDDRPIEADYVTIETETLRASQSAEDLRNLSTLHVPDIVRSASEVMLNSLEDAEGDESIPRHRPKSERRGVSMKRSRGSRLVKLDSVTKLRNRDKTSGYMYVRQKSALGHKWVLMYCTIEADWLRAVFDDKVVELEHLPTTTVKGVGPEIERNSCFYMISPQGKRCYQALTELERRNWMRSLTQSSINALQRTHSSSTDENTERMLAIPGNRQCADCTAVAPEWACIDHGITICIDCSGVHRSMGVNVSKVRSLLLDNWTEENIIHMESIGNDVFNAIYEANLTDKLTESSTREERSTFINLKYIKKSFKEQTADEEEDLEL